LVFGSRLLENSRAGDQALRDGSQPGAFASETRPMHGEGTQRPGSLSKPAAEQIKSKQTQVKGYHLPPEKYKQAVAYSRARYRLYFFSSVYEWVVLLVVLRCHWAARFRDWALGGGRRRRLVQALVFVPLLVLTLSVLDLPTSMYGHWLSLRYQQSVQAWASWMWDWGKEQGIGVVFAIFLVWI